MIRKEEPSFQVIVIQITDEAVLKLLLERRNVSELIDAIADPKGQLFDVAGLGAVSLMSLLHPRMWFRALQALLSGAGGGTPGPQPRRMPGVLAWSAEKGVLALLRLPTIDSRPDYRGFIREHGLADDDDKRGSTTQ